MLHRQKQEGNAHPVAQMPVIPSVECSKQEDGPHSRIIAQPTGQLSLIVFVVPDHICER